MSHMLGVRGTASSAASTSSLFPPPGEGTEVPQHKHKHTHHMQEDIGHDPNPAECQMRCGGELSPPVHGRFGHFFNPALKPSPYSHLKPHRKLLHTKSVWEIKVRNRTNQFIQSLCPEQPAPYQGPYHNVMWDPHVRRGPAFVRFNDLEDPCYIPDTRKRPFVKRKKSFFPLSLGKGTTVKVKEELTDYSQFLEEQGEDQLVACKDQETQIDEISLNRQEKDERWGIESENRFRHNFAVGKDIETQVDRFKISTEMRNFLNPNQVTISRIAKAFKSQLLPQSLLEEMEELELGEIRTQCDEIEEWLMKQRLAEEKEERDLAKKMERIKREEEGQREEAGIFAEVRKRVEAQIFANCNMTTVLSASCTGLERGGKLGTEFSSEKIDQLLGAAAIKKELDRRRAGREMLDEIIWEGVQRTKRRSSRRSSDIKAKTFHKSFNSPRGSDHDHEEHHDEDEEWRKSYGEEGENEEGEDYKEEQDAPGN